MSAVPTSSSTVRPWSRFDLWAATLFILLALLGAYAAVFEAKAMPGAVSAVAVLLADLAYPAIDAIVAYGLVRARAWARPVAVLLLALAGFGGFVQAIGSLKSGTPNALVIAIGVAALLVLLLRPSPRSRWPAGQERAVIAVVVAIVVVTVLRITAAGLFE